MTATTIAAQDTIVVSNMVPARFVMGGDRVFGRGDFVIYVQAADVVTGQDGYVVLRGTDVEGTPVQQLCDLMEIVEVLL